MNRPEDIEEILKLQVIAVVGCSPRPDRPSHQVAAYLLEAGYRVIPVRPAVPEILGERCYPSLRDVPELIDAVDIFRRSEFVFPIVEEAVAVKAKAVWMQDGIEDLGAAELARKNGLRVVMNDCLMRQHLSRFGR
ncbi:MAG: CoA-binding protein [Elusimicrobia bacterium]|nr:CoA-binding protein [Elusimicrobiota bacterium]